jgi:hypothetical protein
MKIGIRNEAMQFNFSFLGIHKSDFRYSVAMTSASQHLKIQLAYVSDINEFLISPNHCDSPVSLYCEKNVLVALLKNPPYLALDQTSRLTEKG